MELLHVKKVLSGGENPIVFKSNNHSGAVRGLHFNPTQTHLLASGATDGEVWLLIFTAFFFYMIYIYIFIF